MTSAQAAQRSEGDVQSTTEHADKQTCAQSPEARSTTQKAASKTRRRRHAWTEEALEELEEEIGL